jgi:hypothetical protein
MRVATHWVPDNHSPERVLGLPYKALHCAARCCLTFMPLCVCCTWPTALASTVQSSSTALLCAHLPDRHAPVFALRSFLCVFA